MVARIYFNTTCLVAGCERVPETSGMCQMHYVRVKKHGDPMAHIPARRLDGAPRLTAIGYVDVWAPGHPLARGDNYVAEHRKVLYDAGVDVPLNCHVHHKNGDKTDNRIENLEVLTPSEHMQHHVDETEFIVNQYGVWPKRGGSRCRVDGCQLPVKGRGLCNSHYLKWSRGRMHVDGLEDQPYRSSHRRAS